MSSTHQYTFEDIENAISEERERIIRILADCEADCRCGNVDIESLKLRIKAEHVGRTG